MSAIAGIVRLDSQPLDRAALQRMGNVLAPYGRDAQDQWVGAGAGMLRTLLRTMPEDAFDRQPACAEDCMVLFAGRLDNRDELRQQLGLDTQQSGQMADSELVLRACQRWDTQALERLHGSYALACWLPQRRRLWLARDLMAGQPLFWHQQAGFFAFASVPKALFCIPGVPRSLCDEHLLNRLVLLPDAGPGTAFKGIQRVEPGQLVLLDGQYLSTRFFQRFDPQREVRFARDEDYVEAFSEHLERAVAACLRSSGPIASHLSSGFDSSTVTALAARQLAARGQRLTAYTAVPREGFAGPVPRDRHGDEGPGAAALARRFENIEHVLIRTAGYSPLELLDAGYISDVDQPAQNLCNGVWGRAITLDAQARGCKVLLSGQMGNMSISYDGFPALAAHWRSGRWPIWWRELCAYQRLHPQWRRRGLALQSIGASLPGWLWRAVAWRHEQRFTLTDYSAVNPAKLAGIDLPKRARKLGWDLDYRPWHDGRAKRIAVLGRADAGAHNISANLSGLDLRDPTSDQRLVEFCLAIPESQYLRDGQPRWLLRRLMGDILPPEILQCRGKGYQAADWYEGLSSDRERLREALQRLRGHQRVGELLDLAALEKLVENWPEGGWASKAVVRGYRLKLLRGIAVGEFIRYAEPDNQ